MVAGGTAEGDMGRGVNPNTEAKIIANNQMKPSITIYTLWRNLMQTISTAAKKESLLVPSNPDTTCIFDDRLLWLNTNIWIKIKLSQFYLMP